MRDKQIEDLLKLCKFVTIDLQHCLLTAPYFLIILLGTFKTLIFEWFEYVTRPSVKTLEDPFIDVKVLEINPPRIAVTIMPFLEPMYLVRKYPIKFKMETITTTHPISYRLNMPSGPNF